MTPFRAIRRAASAMAVTACAFAAGCGESPFDVVSETLETHAKLAAEESGLKPAEASGELRIAAGSAQFAPSVIRGFERALDVRIAFVGDGDDPDLVVARTHGVPELAAAGKIANLDLERLPNVRANFDASFAWRLPGPPFTNAVPYAAFAMGVMYRKDGLPKGFDPGTWAGLGAKCVAGVAAFSGDFREIVGVGLAACGKDVNSTDADDVRACSKVLANAVRCEADRDLKPAEVLFSRSDVALRSGFGVGDGARPARDGFAFAIPDGERYPVACDTFAIAADAARADLAYAFVNYLYVGVVARINMECTCAPMPVKPGLAALDGDFAKDILPAGEKAGRGTLLAPLDEKGRELYESAWLDGLADGTSTQGEKFK